MFGLGFTEILVLAVLGLILLGPDQLPDVARTMGRFFNDLKRSTDEITDEFKKSTLNSQNLLEDIRNDFKQKDTTLEASTDNSVQLEMDTESTAPKENIELEKNGKKPKPH